MNAIDNGLPKRICDNGSRECDSESVFTKISLLTWTESPQTTTHHTNIKQVVALVSGSHWLLETTKTHQSCQTSHTEHKKIGHSSLDLKATF